MPVEYISGQTSRQEAHSVDTSYRGELKSYFQGSKTVASTFYAFIDAAEEIAVRCQLIERKQRGMTEGAQTRERQKAMLTEPTLSSNELAILKRIERHEKHLGTQAEYSAATKAAQIFLYRLIKREKQSRLEKGQFTNKDIFSLHIDIAQQVAADVRALQAEMRRGRRR